MPYTFKMGRPFAPEAGLLIFRGGRDATDFARAVENNRVLLAARQVQIEQARLKLQEREVEIRRQLEQQRINLEAQRNAMQARAQFDPAAKQRGQPGHDGQAKAEALAMVAFGVADLEEFVEDPRLVHRRDADAAVAHFDADALAAHARGQQHATAGRGGVDRVVQQPAEQAGQQPGIGGDRQRLRVRVQTVAQGINQLGVIEEQDLTLQKLCFHGVNMAAVWQTAGDNNAVEASQHSGNPVLIAFSQKGVAHAA